MSVIVESVVTNATVDATVVEVSVTTTPAPSVEIATAGLQGIPGPSGPTGPTGPVAVPNFYESSSAPVGPDRGDQWIVTSEIG